MASDLTNLKAYARSAELHRRAELHRLAAGARVTISEARPITRSRLHLGSLPAAVRGAFAGIKVSSQ
jgi:hypothetical protein